MYRNLREFEKALAESNRLTANDPDRGSVQSPERRSTSTLTTREAADRSVEAFHLYDPALDPNVN